MKIKNGEYLDATVGWIFSLLILHRVTLSRNNLDLMTAITTLLWALTVVFCAHHIKSNTVSSYKVWSRNCWLSVSLPFLNGYTGIMMKSHAFRWLRLRLNMMPITAGFLEPMCESIPLGIYASWSAFYLFGVSPYLWFAGHWCTWFLLDYIQLNRIQVRLWALAIQTILSNLSLFLILLHCLSVLLVGW